MDSDSESEFSYPDIEAAGNIQPFMFEPQPGTVASAASSSSSEEDDDINTERIGNTDW